VQPLGLSQPAFQPSRVSVPLLRPGGNPTRPCLLVRPGCLYCWQPLPPPLCGRAGTPFGSVPALFCQATMRRLLRRAEWKGRLGFGWGAAAGASQLCAQRHCRRLPRRAIAPCPPAQACLYHALNHGGQRTFGPATRPCVWHGLGHLCARSAVQHAQLHCVFQPRAPGPILCARAAAHVFPGPPAPAPTG
jgi:hypothetical protein